MNISTPNRVKHLCISGPHIEAHYVEDVRDYPIKGRTIVINPHISPAYAGEQPKTIIPPLSSTILKDTRIEQATLLILLEVKETTNMGNVILEQGWGMIGNQLGPRSATEVPYPPDTPLWRSPQDTLGTIEFDPSVILGQATTPKEMRKFLMKAYLWFAPGQTNCYIHNKHDYIEIHTQIYGHGRMQKFKAQDYATLYEDLLMSEGYTTSVPFCSVQPNGQFIYPWHQYYADTDCLWLVIEYHHHVS